MMPCTLAFALLFSPATLRLLGADDGAAGLASLKGLVGRWRGTVSWSGAVPRPAGELSARYWLTGNGSAVVEDLESEGVVVMTSVYHLDGPDLRLTHYCGAGNQPRLRASEVDARAGLLRFSFVDVTNLKTSETGHVHGVELSIRDTSHVTLVFTFLASGQESYEHIELTRLSDAAAVGPQG
jgi:hypothetical protein